MDVKIALWVCDDPDKARVFGNREALQLFSMHGFEAVSLADIADELKLTKQAILYHFKTKEALYAKVLEGLSQRLEKVIDHVNAAPEQGADKWRLLLHCLHRHMETDPADAHLIMRELLDVRDRAQTGRKWYLKVFLDQSVALIAQVGDWGEKSVAERRAAAYQMIGAINYFAVSRETLNAIWGVDEVEAMQQRFFETLAQVYR